MNKSGINKKIAEKPQKILILENIRSVYNVGAIFRTADAVGIDKIYLIGITPSPIDRFGRARKDVHKAALGAEQTIEWEYLKSESAVELVEKLKQEDVKTIAVEQSKKSVNYRAAIQNTDEAVAVLVGNEVDGVEEDTLASVDVIAELPMKGEKESLNVSVATGVVLYEFFGK